MQGTSDNEQASSFKIQGTSVQNMNAMYEGSAMIVIPKYEAACV